MPATDFPCCEPAARMPLTYPPGEMHDRYDNPPDVARWIAPTLLDRFPCGPYAVHAYFPATQRELTLRNHLPESAAAAAEDFASRGCDVHVSLDTCG